MKLTIEKLKSMIEEVYKQKKENSRILDEATFSSVKGRVDVDKKPDARTAAEFVVMSSDRGERSPAENLMFRLIV